VENLDQADALLFGRVTYEMMDTFRQSARRRRQPGSSRLVDHSRV
jgi:hypothetical protein